MTKHKPLINDQGEVRELTTEDLKRFRPIREAGLSTSMLHNLGVRGPQKAPTKEQITLRLSREVVEIFRASGSGWQTRIDAALKEWLRTHKPA